MKLVKKIGVCLVLISLLSACKKDEKDDDTTNLALLLALSGANTCTYTAAGITLPIASISATQNGGVQSISFTTSGAIGIGAIQIASAPANSIGSFGNSSGSYSYVIYKGNCPLSTSSTLAVAGTDYTVLTGTSNITASGSIRFNVAGAYTIILTSNSASGSTFQLTN
ncbi:hypothetical protein DLM76_08300 [Leptospira yasudae]|uniref:hypothetical protein n=1 Tax=Leptospira yasudae TaxID=2202201 RepID=UPI000E59E059|nr:hypothetical protein [Leptospira yasudae]RHX95294.1 hypothetical protein DLM76_08300 [Leptospira yasudae]